MAADRALLQNDIVLDACCLINLYASGYMNAILSSLGTSVFAVDYVIENEIPSIWEDTDEAGTEDAGGDFDWYSRSSRHLQALIDSGTLKIAVIGSEDEEVAFVNSAAALDDGEAMTVAVALTRGWAIATDDRKCINLLRRIALHNQIVTTPELVKYWVDSAQPTPTAVRTALNNIRVHARYVPARDHPLVSWWRAQAS